MAGPVCLVIEDEPGICWALRLLLGQAGAEVVVATDGGVALDQALKRRPAAIFLDIKLPDIDGFKLARRIKQRLPQAAIVLLSAFFYADDPKVRAALAEGIARRFIAKPFCHEEIRRTLAEILTPASA